MSLVEDYMDTTFAVVSENATINDAAQLMNSLRQSLVMVEQGGVYIGVVSDTDFTRKVAFNNIPVGHKVTEIMSAPIIGVDCNTTMAEANGIMQKSRIRHLAVRKRGEIIGILSVTDFFRYHDDVEKSLKELSVRDALTGLYNRRYFEECIEKEHKRANRNQRSLAVVLVDIDCFKAYNDAYGNSTGDQCLQKIASSFDPTLNRLSDFTARYGGEEFIMVLPDTSAKGALHLAEVFRSKIEELRIDHRKSSVGPWVTVSLGVGVTVPERKSHWKSLLEDADQALNKAKSQGRNRVAALFH